MWTENFKDWKMLWNTKFEPEIRMIQYYYIYYFLHIKKNDNNESNI